MFRLYIQLYILIVITNTNINSYIVFNLYSYKTNFSYNFPESFIYNYYYTQISIGTPPQKLEYNIQLQNPYISILSDKSNSSLQLFKSSISSTYKQIKYDKFESDGLEIPDEEIPVQNYSTKFNGYISKDIVNINNININDFIFISVNESISKYSFKYIPGILGLGIKYNKNIEEHRFISQLKKHNIIDNYYFYIKDINTDNPLLIIGDTPLNIDINKCSNKYIKQAKSLIYTESYEGAVFIGVPVWGLQFNKIYLEDNEINVIKNVKFSIEHNIIIGTRDYEKIIRQIYFDKYIEQKLCFINNTQDYKYYYCKRNIINYNDIPTLSFYSIDLNYTFKFNYKDLFIEKDDYIIYIIFFNTILYTDQYYWTFGMPFFKKYLPYFNLDKKTVGICIKDSNNQNILYKQIIIILILVLLVLIGVFYICLKKLYNRRKKVKSKYLEKRFINSEMSNY